MPLQSDLTPGTRPHICIFGDSHIGAVRLAIDAGHPIAGAADITFFGAAGPQFREIDYVDGHFVCRTDECAELAGTVSGNKSSILDLTEFEFLLFVGARLRPFDFLVPYLHYVLAPDVSASAALRRLATERFLLGRRSVRTAREIADDLSIPVVFSPAPYLIWSEEHVTDDRSLLSAFPEARHAGAGDRDRLIREMTALLSDGGVHLLSQPDATVVEGCFTDPAFQSREGDLVHVDAAFAALMLDQVSGLLEGLRPVTPIKRVV